MYSVTQQFYLLLYNFYSLILVLQGEMEKDVHCEPSLLQQTSKKLRHHMMGSHMAVKVSAPAL